ncbi:aldehyde dehydrogenase family protein [uncultured Methanospirillum sp.]|uniref:aldehyde dehydrogenase family protein n=1 Tax=uncultured Methanospirillum sp. TaxID=262503 RepID=UPI0029C928A2|nr:aldehyde dehydrogenase family protein [uncultured Methanospirillum sp.]
MDLPYFIPAFDDIEDPIPVINPATGALVGRIHQGSTIEVDTAVLRASEAFPKWAVIDATERAKVLFKAAALVRNRQAAFAGLLTSEQGKPLKESKNEIAGFARILEYYASISGLLKGDYGNSSAYGHAIVSRKPVGVCGAIIPWNVPAIIMGWKVGPALAAGNSIILKPATTAPLTCIQLAGCLVEAGLPADILQVVTGPGPVVGEAIASHPGIRAVSFTGEVGTGRRVASLAAPYFKRVTLELGGSDPMIVCNDANLAEAAKGAVAGRFFNCGQTCTAVKRLFVDSSVEEEFVHKLQTMISSLKVGNGLESGVDMGPVHSLAQRSLIADQVERTIEGGFGTIKTGGKDITIGNSGSSFFEPTLLSGLDPEAPVLKEEVFGPVLPVMPFETLDDAISVANSTQFGLGASVWTHDTRIVSRACEELQAGIVWVNQHLKIPPEVPFGGTKDSGIGRENGRYALEHYLEEKTILIKP